MPKVQIYRNGMLAGVLEKEQNKYIFRYEDTYFFDNTQPAISLTLPKNVREYQSEFLFPFFFNMLSEGVNKRLQSVQLKIDENDYFSLLLATTQYDTIGAITIKPIDTGLT